MRNVRQVLRLVYEMGSSRHQIVAGLGIARSTA